MIELYERLKSRDAGLASLIDTCKNAASPILKRIVERFPTYTNHDIEHSEKVISIFEHIIDTTIDLSNDELYILLTASLLHDIGMAVNDEQLKVYCNKCNITYEDSFSVEAKREIIRDFHNIFSQFYILDNWSHFDIPSERYAGAISCIAKGHRKVDLLDNEFNDSFVNSGSERVRISFLAAALRMADEFDITADRTPELYCKYFFPNNKMSQNEFKKHLATNVIRFGDEGDAIVTIFYNTDDTNGYNSLRTMFNKIETQLDYCQEVLNRRNMPALKVRYINTVNENREFNPISIKFKVDNERVFKTLIGKNLYKDRFVALRESIQNAVDACRYKKMFTTEHIPKITVELNDNVLTITDNGIGMDKNVLENYFSTIGKSFYIHDIESNKGFKSIGQFGIGVASYFLICSKFRLITCKNGEILDFDISNNFDEYFHLNPSNTPILDGTKISFILNEDALEEINTEYLIENIKSTFRFCEIPILVVNKVDHVLLSTELLNKDSIDKTFNSCFLPYFSERAGDLKLHDVSVANEYIQASCGFVFSNSGMPIDILSFPIIDDIRFWFRDVNDGFNKINLYHRGVYIKTIANTELFKNIVGDINIEKGIELKLDRNDLGIGTQLVSLLDELNGHLAIKLLSIINAIPNTIYHLQFLELIYMCYINMINPKEAYFHRQIKSLIYYANVDKDSEKLQLLDYDAMSMIDEWDLITKKSFDLNKDNDLLGNHTFICHLDNTISMYIKYLLSLNYGLTYFNTGALCFVRFHKNRKDFIKMIGNEYAVPFYLSNSLYTSIEKIILWNTSNPFIAWAVENTLCLKDKEDISSILFETIRHTYFDINFVHQGIKKQYKFSISKLNSMFRKFNEKYKLSFTATNDWMPPDMQSYIVD